MSICLNYGPMQCQNTNFVFWLAWTQKFFSQGVDVICSVANFDTYMNFPL